MNLAEYRRELHSACRDYRENLQQVSDQLQKRLAAADAEFFGDEEKAVIAEAVPVRRRVGDNY